ncbi:MAG: hypothetical protein ACREI9_08110 [Nitrospiraceae bacterium]
MGGLLDALSMPYVFLHEGLFVLGVSVVIVGLLFFRVGLMRRRRHKDSAER